MINLLPEKQSIFLRASLADICNFSCQYCAYDLGMENHTPNCLHAPLLTAEKYIHNLHLLAEHGFQTISFTGGEPLLNPQFSQILDGSREIYKTVEITTNGSKLFDNIDAIIKYVDVLKISIDAIDPELRVSIARNPKAAETVRIIEECCMAGIKTIGLNFVYMKQNEEELPRLVDFAAKLKQRYKTDIYISILDLYFTIANREFWREQFIPLSTLREKLSKNGKCLNHRIRIGCDSYNFIWNNIVVNIKDSFSCTHRAKICLSCGEYCQEGIYSLKHSASGWIGVCPSNNIDLGFLLDKDVSTEIAHERIDKYIEILNSIERIENTGKDFCKFNHLDYPSN